jgi:GNAT superfamily N-acetyltransferase
MRLALEREGHSTAPDDAAFQETVRRWFQEHTGSDSFRAWIAEEDGEPVAVGGLVLVSRPPYTGNTTGLEGLVTSMYTVPKRRSRGIGAAILDVMTEAARAVGVGRLVLYSSHGAQSLYRRNGFTDDGTRGAPMERWLAEGPPRSASS